MAFSGAAGGVPPLRRRPKGAALWTPATFEKVDETFICASRLPLPPLKREVAFAKQMTEGFPPKRTFPEGNPQSASRTAPFSRGPFS